MLKCIIIDDEELARSLLKSYVKKLDFLDSKGEFENPLEAISLLKTETIDVIFLDIQMPQLKGTSQEYITIKSGYDLHKVKLADIQFIKSDSEYVTFYFDDKKIMSYQTLKSLEGSLPSTVFMRVHRSYIVNKDKVTGLKGRDLLLGEITISVSDSYYENVKNELFL